MTDYEAGYLQALKDVQDAARRMVQDPETSPEGRVDLLGMVSFLGGLIETVEARRDQGEEPDRASENRRPEGM